MLPKVWRKGKQTKICVYKNSTMLVIRKSVKEKKKIRYWSRWAEQLVLYEPMNNQKIYLFLYCIQFCRQFRFDHIKYFIFFKLLLN